MKRHLLLLSALIFALLLAGLLFLNGGLLALAIPFVVYVGAAFWFAPEKVGLTAERRLSTEWVAENAPATVHATVTNQGQSLEEVLIDASLPAETHLIEGDPTTLVALRAGETLELTQTLQGPRGEYHPPALLATACETFGLFGQVIPLDAPFQLAVRPHSFHLRSMKIRPPQTRGFSGPIPARQSGSGLDFFTLREYQPGYPQRQINWRVAARYERDLFTNTYEQERVADVGIILDSRRQVDVVLGGESLFEHSVRAVAALASTFLRDGNRVGLLVYGGSIQRVFPGYGKVQRFRILRTLSKAKTGHNYALENLGQLPTRSFPSHSQIVLVSPLMSDDVPTVTQLRARGYSVLVVCPDPLDYEFRDMPQPNKNDLAYRIARSERYFLLQRVRRVGVQVIEWKVNEPLEASIHKTLESQPALRRQGMVGR